MSLQLLKIQDARNDVFPVVVPTTLQNDNPYIEQPHIVTRIHREARGET